MDDSAITGCILGTAVGDSLGLPYEGISRSRGVRFLGKPDRHRFLFGKGMISDDTEHACMVAQSLISSANDPDQFARDFARRLKWWALLLPAGIGRATLQASIKLWFGASPQTSGVFSAGNGPAMRAAIIGASFDNVERMALFVRASTRITHRDPKAEFGAIAVALAANLSRKLPEIDPAEFIELVSKIDGPGGELTELVRLAAKSAAAGHTTQVFAEQIGLGKGVTGYTYHTVPIVIQAWLRHPRDFRSAVMSVIECGGDTDTTAALVGGIIGAGVGEAGIPNEWTESIWEWPRSIAWMRKLSVQLSNTLSSQSVALPLRPNPFGVFMRNLVFLVVVLYHGFRRLLPPY